MLHCVSAGRIASSRTTSLLSTCPRLLLGLVLLASWQTAALAQDDGAARCLAVAGIAAAPAQDSNASAAQIDAARKAAREDRNRESARLFEQAIAGAPAQCRSLLAEFADQLTYSDAAARAVPLYRFLLAQPGSADDQRYQLRSKLALALSWSKAEREALKEYETLLREKPDDHQARLGKARVLSWLDEVDAALAEYDAVLARKPDEQEAVRGRARMLAWQNRHYEAWEVLQRHLAAHPDDREAAVLAAQVQQWMGHPDRAAAMAANVLAADPANRDAQGLQRELRQALRPATRFDRQSSEQSDDLDIDAWQLEHTIALADGRARIGPRYQRYRYRPQGGDAVLEERVGGYGQVNLTEHVALTGELFADRLRGDRVRDTLATGNAYLTYRPDDRIRVDAGFGRSLFDNIRSLEQRLYANAASLSVDLRPDHLSRLTARASRAWYSDTNRRNWLQLEAERQLSRKPVLLVGLRYTYFDFAERFDNGYFNPDRYHSLAATVHLYGNRNGRLYYDVDASYGREYATPDGNKPIWSVGTKASYLLTDRLELEGRVQRFQSSNASTSGFGRTTVGIALRALW